MNYKTVLGFLGIVIIMHIIVFSGCIRKADTTKASSIANVSLFENCTKTNDYRNQKHWCYSNILYKYDTIAVCDVLPSDEKDFCYKEFNIVHRGYGQCDKINDQQWRDECFWSYANNKDHTQCLLINSTDVRSWCLRDVGIGTNSTTTCDMISERRDIPELVRCYETIARQKGDISICDDISKKTNFPAERDRCLMLVAMDLRDESICDKLSNKSLSAINICNAGVRHLV